jgi:predicted GIY-YIG superfamily endonuclease
MTFWAYMLHCRGGAFYVGHTDNLDQRIGQHQAGMIAGFTADHLPVALVWSQDFPTRHEAKTAEKQIKGWSRVKKMALIRGDWGRISTLAKGKSGPSTSSGRAGEEDSVDFSATTSTNPARPELAEGPSFTLRAHPQTPPHLVNAIQGRIKTDPITQTTHIEYRTTPATNLLIPQPVAPTRTDELWRTTCFELFAKSPDSPAYTEYNFAPSGTWAAYGFDGTRSGMRDAPLAPPVIAAHMDGTAFILTARLILPPGPLILGISAVIEEGGGTKSYWALAHPAEGPPDFHHPDCFVLTLGAPGGT